MKKMSGLIWKINFNALFISLYFLFMIVFTLSYIKNIVNVKQNGDSQLQKYILYYLFKSSSDDKKRIIFNCINEINMKYIDTDSLKPEHTLAVLELAIAIVYTL